MAGIRTGRWCGIEGQWWREDRGHDACPVAVFFVAAVHAHRRAGAFQLAFAVSTSIGLDLHVPLNSKIIPKAQVE